MMYLLPGFLPLFLFLCSDNSKGGDIFDQGRRYKTFQLGSVRVGNFKHSVNVPTKIEICNIGAGGLSDIINFSQDM